MDVKKTRLDRGQSIVVVALLMIGLVGLTALALDGGYAFWQRRVAQNAADAGALAGANELCTQKLSKDVDGVATTYIQMNKANKTQVLFSEASKAVTVTTNIPFKSFFAGVIGFDVITVTANAVAMCSPACVSEGVLPIAWSCALPLSTPSAACDLKYKDEIGPLDDQCKYGEDYYYVIADSNDAAMDIQCAPIVPTPTPTSTPDPLIPTPTPDPLATPTPTPSVDFVDCDINDDGVNDVNVLSGGSKAWLDLTGQSGAADINNWIKYGYPGEVKTHVWYPSQTGNVGSSYQAVFDSHLGDVVAIPVFDYFYKGDPGSSSNPNWHSQDGCVPAPCPPGNTSGDYYHVITFAAFYVSCVYSGGSASSFCPGRDALINSTAVKNKYKNSLKTVEGCFVEDAVVGASGSIGSGCLDSGAYAVHLVK